MEEVSTPFRVVIKPGSSTFDVNVPKHYLTNDRRFYFKHLRLQPDFYNKEADALGLDSDPNLSNNIDYLVQVKLEYKDISTFYGPNYKNSTAVNTTLDAIEKLNDHFENNKPDISYATPFFIDWIDTVQHALLPPNKYVPKEALQYYDEIYRPALHGDRLPLSVQGMDDVNNFLPPIGTMKSPLLYDRIRLRLWMGPWTRAVFSSLQPFVDDWGFTEAQFGPPYKQQHTLTNRTHTWRPVLIAEQPPKRTFSKVDFRMLMAPFNTTMINRSHVTSMTQREWNDNAKVTLYLKSLFQNISNNLNTIFSFGFDEDEKRFYFHLPTSDNLTVTILCSPDFALRLGYGQESFIVKGMQARPQKDHITITDAQIKAMAVVYNTGPIICTLDNISSNTTSGADDQFMAALYPMMPGVLMMPDSGKSHSVHLSILRQSTAAFVPITFRLLRIYDNNKSANFMWSHDAYVYGTFTGFCYTRQTYKKA